MITLCIALMVLLALGGYYKDRSLFSPRVTFCVLFSLICYLASMRLHSIYEVPDLIYLFVGGGVICFFIGASVSKMITSRTHRGNQTKCVPDYFSLKVYKFFFLIALFLSITYSLGAIKILLSGGTLNDIYHLHLGNGINDDSNQLQHSFLDQVLSVYILTPIQYFLTPLSICLYLRKGDKKYLYYGFLLALFRVVYHGGRAALVFAILYFVVLYFVVPKTKENAKLFKQVKMTLLVVGGLSVALFVSMTVGRDAEFGQNTYLYVAGAIPNLSERFVQLLTYNHTYGLLSFRGLIYPFLSFNRAITGSSSVQETIDAIFSDTQIGVDIGADVEYNAFVTCFYYFYADGGLIGVVLGSLLFGFISQYIYEKMKSNGTLLWYSIYAIFFVNVIVYSFNAFMLSYIQVSWALVYAILFFKLSKNKRQLL